MTITPFVIADYAEIELANGVGLEHWNLHCGVIPVLKAMEANKTFWTLRDDEGVLLIGGYNSIYSGVCEVMLFPSRRFVERPVLALRLLKRYVKSWSLKFRRVQLNCRAEEKFIKFAKFLGFEQEGILRRFDHQNRDHIVMAIVR